MVLTNGVLNPWKMAATLPPILYSMLLFMRMQQSALWLTVLAVLALSTLWYIVRADYSLWATAPALAGGLLLFTCAVALGQGYDLNNFVPISSTAAELWVCALLGVGYIAWGVSEVRRSSR